MNEGDVLNTIDDELPAGQIYVCSACGKTSRTRSGVCKDGSNATEHGTWWDASCVANAVRCYDKKSGEPFYQAVVPHKEPQP